MWSWGAVQCHSPGEISRITAEPIPAHPPQTLDLFDPSTILDWMENVASASLDGTALDAWRSYLQSHAAILRELDAELIAEHGMTTRDYEVLLYVAQAPDRRLPMSALSERTMLTRSGIT